MLRGLEDFAYFTHYGLKRRATLAGTSEVSAQAMGRFALGQDGSDAVLERKQHDAQKAKLEDYVDLRRRLDESNPVEFGPFSIECRPTLHSIPTTAFRIKAAGRTFAFSADSAHDPALIEWLSPADLIVQEATALNQSPVHTPYARLAELPESLRAKMRLTHLPDDFDAASSVIETLQEGRCYPISSGGPLSRPGSRTMSRPRLSILGLIAGVVACGVAFAALRSGSDYWLSAFYTMTVALLLGAVVAARYRRGTGRAFWFGFAVFGWGGFLLTSNPWLPAGYSLGRGFSWDLNRNLLSTKVIQFLVVRIRMGTTDLDQIDEITANTIGIVSLLLILAVAIGGGLFAVAMKKRARKIAVVDPSRRPNAVPSLVILVGLSFVGLGSFDRPAPANLSNALWEAGEPSLSMLAPKPIARPLCIGFSGPRPSIIPSRCESPGRATGQDWRPSSSINEADSMRAKSRSPGRSNSAKTSGKGWSAISKQPRSGRCRPGFKKRAAPMATGAESRV